MILVVAISVNLPVHISIDFRRSGSAHRVSFTMCVKFLSHFRSEETNIHSQAKAQQRKYEEYKKRKNDITSINTVFKGVIKHNFFDSLMSYFWGLILYWGFGPVAGSAGIHASSIGRPLLPLRRAPVAEIGGGGQLSTMTGMPSPRFNSKNDPFLCGFCTVLWYMNSVWVSLVLIRFLVYQWFHLYLLSVRGLFNVVDQSITPTPHSI